MSPKRKIIYFILSTMTDVHMVARLRCIMVRDCKAYDL